MDTDDEDFICSLNLPEDLDLKDFRSMTFSKKNKFVCVLCDKRLLFYDIGSCDVISNGSLDIKIDGKNHTSQFIDSMEDEVESVHGML